MYRILLIFFIFTEAAAYRCNQGIDVSKQLTLSEHSSSYCKISPIEKQRRYLQNEKSNIDDEFINIGMLLQEIDKKIGDICNRTVKNCTREVYGEMKYVLIYDLPEYEGSNVSVKLKNRVLYIEVKKEKQVFSDIRILPDMLDLNEALWVHIDKELRVMIPYMAANGQEREFTCSSKYTDEVINVVIDELYGIDLR